MRTSWMEVIPAHMITADDPAREASAVRLRSSRLLGHDPNLFRMGGYRRPFHVTLLSSQRVHGRNGCCAAGWMMAAKNAQTASEFADTVSASRAPLETPYSSDEIRRPAP